MKSSGEYNEGKAIVKGRRAGKSGCADCHNKKFRFKRESLKKLTRPVSALIQDCELHKPCFKNEIDADELKAIDVYFKKRYRLKHIQ